MNSYGLIYNNDDAVDHVSDDLTNYWFRMSAAHLNLN